METITSNHNHHKFAPEKVFGKQFRLHAVAELDENKIKRAMILLCLFALSILHILKLFVLISSDSKFKQITAFEN